MSGKALQWKLEVPPFEYPLYASEIEILRPRDTPPPIEWAIDNYKLSTSHAKPGDFIPYQWQREPIDAIRDCDSIVFVGPTQSGKSMIGEIAVSWCIDNMPMNAMLCYAKRETVEDIFVDRVRPMIREVPAIRKYWSGDEQDLTRKKVRLSHMFLRVASAETQNDIATWAAGLVYMSEVSKYRKHRGWDPVEALKRRQEAYRIMGRHKTIIESSPKEEGDCLWEEIHRMGVLVRKPHYPCPKCGRYQTLSIRQVKEDPNPEGKLTHDPDLIRRYNLAHYECVFCKQTIAEDSRMDMSEKVVWLADGESVNPDGTVNRKTSKELAYHWNRFVDYSFTFCEALARFFVSQRKGAEALQIFTNEDMAEFWMHRAQARITDVDILSRMGDYYQYREGDVPVDVVVLLCGIDTQDNGFFFTVSGYGNHMHKYLLRCGFVESPKGLSVDGKDPRQVAYERLVGAIPQFYKRKDGRKVNITFGFIDKGGHRSDDVSYICEHLPFLRPYVGLTVVDVKKPLIEQSNVGNHYNGQSMLLSKSVGLSMSSVKWHLPKDTQQDYIDQVRNEYIDTKRDTSGNTKSVYVKITPNHYRSCENMCYAAVKHQGLEELMFDSTAVEMLESDIVHGREAGMGLGDGEDSADRGREGSSYFSSRGGRRSFY